MIEFILGSRTPAQYDGDARVGEDGVDQPGELAVPVADQEPDPP
jgi:hypothetical protein